MEFQIRCHPNYVKTKITIKTKCYEKRKFKKRKA